MGGLSWHKVSLQVPSVPPNGIAKGPMVEFVFTDGADAWDKPAGIEYREWVWDGIWV